MPHEEQPRAVPHAHQLAQKRRTEPHGACVLLHRRQHDLPVAAQLGRRVLQREAVLLHRRQRDLAVVAQLGRGEMQREAVRCQAENPGLQWEERRFHSPTATEAQRMVWLQASTSLVTPDPRRREARPETQSEECDSCIYQLSAAARPEL